MVDKYCVKCGSLLVDGKCPKCQSNGAKYCTVCGALLINGLCPNGHGDGTAIQPQKVVIAGLAPEAYSKRSRLAAGLFQLFFGFGLGQWFLGYKVKSLIMMIGQILWMSIAIGALIGYGIDSARFMAAIGVYSTTFMTVDQIRAYYDFLEPYSFTLLAMIPIAFFWSLWQFIDAIKILTGHPEKDADGKIVKKVS